jgi:hypothetical protein
VREGLSLPKNCNILIVRYYRRGGGKMNNFVMSVLLVLLLAAPVEASPNAIGNLLAFLTQSALETDRLQTRHWVDGTPERPVISPNGLTSWEGNPLLAGRPEALNPYFDVLDRAAEVWPRTGTSPLARMAQLAWAAGEIYTVVHNNNSATRKGFPLYWAVKYRWRF